MKLLIQNGLLVDPTQDLEEKLDLLLEDGRVAGLDKRLTVPEARTLDASGCVVAPGFIDLHVHLREPGEEYKETIETGSQAAAAGGFTSVCAMPNTTPVNDNAAVTKFIVERGREKAVVNVFPVGALTNQSQGETLAELGEMVEAGAVAVSDDGRSVMNAEVLRRAMEYAKMADLLLIEHCEDPLLSSHGVMNEGLNSTLLGLKGDPAIAETVIVARDIELANYLKTKIHLAHMSLKRSMELIRLAKSERIQVTAEVCPHHFTLTDEAVKTYDTATKVNPPLRSKEDVEAVRQALKDGTIDCIVTDHAPHTVEEKELDFDHAPFGMIGLETSVGLTVSELVNKGVLTWTQMAEKMSFQPARITGLKNKGKIKEGFDADLTIIDPEQEWVFKKEEIVSKSKNSPFIGRKLKGLVTTTICGGKVTYQHNGLG